MKARTPLHRVITRRTRGSTHGPITRLVSPADLGQVLKPYVFLDRFEAPAGGQPPQFGMHPHSGIATLTYLIHGQAGYEDPIRHQMRPRSLAIHHHSTRCPFLTPNLEPHHEQPHRQQTL